VIRCWEGKFNVKVECQISMHNFNNVHYMSMALGVHGPELLHGLLDNSSVSHCIRYVYLVDGPMSGLE